MSAETDRQRSKEWYRKNRTRANARAKFLYLLDSEHRTTAIQRAQKRAAEKREEIRQYQQAYRQRNKHALRMKAIERLYGITEIEYAALIAQQNNQCAICLKDFHKESRWMRIHIDHKHSTNQVRSLLCGNCNVMIGYARENESILQAAIEYLRKHNA